MNSLFFSLRFVAIIVVGGGLMLLRAFFLALIRLAEWCDEQILATAFWAEQYLFPRKDSE
jgi:hypothetical protein